MASFTIDYFELPTGAMGESKRFLADAFGWGFTEYGPAYAEIHAGTLGGLNGDSADRPSALTIGIRTDDIESAREAVITAGGRISRDLYDYPGGRRLFFVEPGGTELMLYQPHEAV